MPLTLKGCFLRSLCGAPHHQASEDDDGQRHAVAAAAASGKGLPGPEHAAASAACTAGVPAGSSSAGRPWTHLGEGGGTGVTNSNGYLPDLPSACWKRDTDCKRVVLCMTDRACWRGASVCRRPHSFCSIPPFDHGQRNQLDRSGAKQQASGSLHRPDLSPADWQGILQAGVSWQVEQHRRGHRGDAAGGPGH